MTSFFPDLNVWLPLSVSGHAHHPGAWRWLQEDDEPVLLCPFTQLGLLRLPTNQAAMGEEVLDLAGAWPRLRPMDV